MHCVNLVTRADTAGYCKMMHGPSFFVIPSLLQRLNELQYATRPHVCSTLFQCVLQARKPTHPATNTASEQAKLNVLIHLWISAQVALCATRCVRHFAKHDTDIAVFNPSSRGHHLWHVSPYPQLKATTCGLSISPTQGGHSIWQLDFHKCSAILRGQTRWAHIHSRGRSRTRARTCWDTINRKTDNTIPAMAMRM